MNPLHVEPAHLREAALTVDATADDLLAAVDKVDVETTEPWGADPLGVAIAGCFKPAFEVAFDCVDANLTVLREYGEKLGLMADSYDRTEDENSQGMVAVRRQLDALAGR